MAAIVKAFKEYWDEMLAVGLGIVVTDVVGDTVKGFLEPIIGGFIEAKWMDAITELVIGFGLLAIGEMFVPIKWRAYTRLASFGALGIGIANVISTAIGIITPAPAPAGFGGLGTKPRSVTFVPPAVVARPPEIFS